MVRSCLDITIRQVDRFISINFDKFKFHGTCSKKKIKIKMNLRWIISIFRTNSCFAIFISKYTSSAERIIFSEKISPIFFNFHSIPSLLVMYPHTYMRLNAYTWMLYINICIYIHIYIYIHFRDCIYTNLIYVRR